MPQPPTIRERVTTGNTPPAPNGPPGVAIALPGETTTLRADPRQEYVSGGVGGSGTWYQNIARTLPWAVDDITQDFGDDLYERMLTDPQVASVVNLFKASILENGLDLSPAIEDEDTDGYAQAAAICDAATAMLDDLDPDLDTVLWNLMDALPLGNRVAEQVYDLGDLGGRQGLLLQSLRVKPRHMTAFVVDGFLRLLGLVAFIPGVGAPVMQGYLLNPKETPNLLPREKFAVLSFRPKDNDPRGTSVLRPAYTPWQLKQQVIREWVKYLTQFASPSLIGTTPENAQPALGIDALGNPIIDPTTGKPMVEQSPEQLMLAQLINFKNASALAFPFGSKVEPLVSDGEGQAFIAAIDRFDREIVKAVLSQTLATEEGEHQARAAADVHQDVVDTIVRQAKRAVVRMVRQDVLRPWVTYNWGEQARALVPHATLGHAEEPDLPALWTAAAALKTASYLAPSQYQPLDRQIGLPERLPEEVAAIQQQQERALQAAQQPQQPGARMAAFYDPSEQRNARGEWTDGGRHFVGFTGQATLQYGRGEQPKVQAALKTILGRVPKNAELARLFGAPDGAKVHLSLQGPGAVHARIRHADWQDHEQTLYLERPGLSVVRLDLYRTAKGVGRGEGLGTAAFGTQVAEARRLGVKAMVADAVGGPEAEENGYYTWARLGFDAPVPNTVRSGLPRELQQAPNLHTLLATKQGQNAWKARGQSFEGEFHTHPDSPHSTMLETYIREHQQKVRLQHGG